MMVLIDSKCAFIIEIRSPILFLRSLMSLFSLRKIQLQELHMRLSKPDQPEGVAFITVFCDIERDRMKHMVQYIKALPGVLSIEWLRTQGSEQTKRE
jgi:hypothetical protein